jgi:hypothetical protein
MSFRTTKKATEGEASPPTARAPVVGLSVLPTKSFDCLHLRQIPRYHLAALLHRTSIGEVFMGSPFYQIEELFTLRL